MFSDKIRSFRISIDENMSGKGTEITPTRFYQKLSTMPNNIHQHNVETINNQRGSYDYSKTS